MNTIYANGHRKTKGILLLPLLLLAFVCSANLFAQDRQKNIGESNSQESDSVGNAANGARIFVAYGCYECHGRAAQGAVTGPRLAPDPIPLPGIIRELRHPNEMPPYSEKTVSEAEIGDIRAFLLSLPASPKPDNIAILNK
jgi:mono/diheme cytochrome c family protein